MAQNNAARAGQPTTSSANLPPEVASVLDGVSRLLADGQAGQALASVEAVALRSPWVDNARAVCFLRLGRPAAAVEALRRVVFDSTGFAVRSDAHPVHQANYAAALLLDGNTDGFFAILADIRDRGHPAVSRLDDAVRRWKAGMSWGRWVVALVWSSGRPPSLDYPPGEIYPHGTGGPQ
ncbi:MAG TPA: hypothetical protein VM529_11550 [Gemmata sp.]|nr:hypothetical protein [Gemmata sp.]